MEDKDLKKVQVINQLKGDQLAHDDIFADEIPKGLTKYWRGIIHCPATKIRDYFGEKIAMYFSFLSYYTFYLIFPGVLGIPVFICQFWPRATWNQTINAVYACFMVIWMIMLFEGWKRKEIFNAINWGQTDFEEQEVERSAFRGDLRRSPVDDNKEMYFSSLKKSCRLFITFSINTIMIMFVLGVIVSILYLRKALYELWEGESTFLVTMSTLIPSIVNAFQIIIFNQIYSTLAYKLTNYENHKTQSEYEKALIIKTYIFQFLNSFNILFYFAFAKRIITGCIGADETGVMRRSFTNLCTDELANQMRSIMIIAIFKNIIEIGLPALKTCIKKRKNKSLYDTTKHTQENIKLLVRIEEQMSLGKYAYKEIDGTYYDYLEIMMQMGYVCMFSISFPLAPMLAFINNLIEIQVDKTKLTKFTRRPIPMGGENLGIWKPIFLFITTLGCVSTLGVLIITE